MSTSLIVNKYLALYNIIAALLWFVILFQTLRDAIIFLNHDSDVEPTAECIYISHSYTDYPHKTLVLVQVFNAVVEISNALLGIVKSSIPTVLLQFLARLLITIGISYYVPESEGNFHFMSYITLSLAWSVTEVIRYSFFSAKLVKNDIPYGLLWLRYSTFFILYPAGLFSELYVVYLSLDSVRGYAYYWFLIFALTMYIPGFFVLYGYMIKQRKKVLNASNAKKLQ
ncbi:uncharacterized protein AC631_03717 [Debaryomyces fabryi]|uniref:Very-long-chain (3R)-3-hydroxyacyl-CoA dehydratase n=1 Tax=Debaryomyces fabryi TaxID=58627 RepID=A0A0V1PWG6_9ASCO|nr:uncharacterized protein AC631_03717 [Debaryomyces fabryi]KSA00531.1 hypothetical protein AC631_03717 [Debaryomyces fabryi]CUM55165.1 unnamed protein product [Debaryomyces fabryi]